MERGYNLYIKERGYCILTLLSRFVDFVKRHKINGGKFVLC